MDPIGWVFSRHLDELKAKTIELALTEQPADDGQAIEDAEDSGGRRVLGQKAQEADE